MSGDRHARPAGAGRTAATGADVRVAVFGGLSVDRAGQPCGLHAGQRKCLALLAVLAVAGRRGVSRDKLMALLGPDLDMIRARNALSQVVFRARRALGQRIIEGKDELTLNPNVATSDVADFERALADGRLEDAAALYQGPFLDGFYLRDAREFERWTADVRSRFEREYRSALDTLATGASRRGDLAGAVAWGHRRLDADPLSSPAARRLVQALVASGDRETALRVGLAYAERVRSELEAEPDTEFSDLLRLVRAGRIPADGGDASGSVTARVRAVLSRSASHAEPVARVADGAPRSPAGPDRTRVRSVGRLAAAAAAAATLIGSTLLLGSRPARPPAVFVPPFVNATGDALLDKPTKLAAEWTTQGIAATGLFTVADVDGRLRRPLHRASAVLDRDPVFDVVRRSGASLLLLGEFVTDRHDSIVVRLRIIRTRDGAVLVERETASALAQSPDMLARFARDRAIDALATVLRHHGGRGPTD